jgi:malonate-semialdehyde dehydrogenase (acetylating)/methylmalonate-semialdehyde dehydrogenase
MSTAAKRLSELTSVGGQSFIAAKWVDGEGQTVRQLLNPADTTEVVAEVREASLTQADAAADAAAGAFKKWSVTPAMERARVLFRFRELLEANYLALAQLIVSD